ncbi:MAG: GGDEF domain-containing protein, partial [Planctomycetota bacterium]
RAAYLGADEVTGPHATDSPTALLGAIRMALRRRGLRQKLAADHRRFQAEAVTDSLTGAYNRRFFDSQLTKEISRSRRYDSPVSLLMVDVDHFKVINDSFGHQVGDRVLQEMVQVIRRTIRTPDLLARFGGEEFALILPSTGPRGAAHLGERLLQRIARHPFPLGEGGVPQTVTVSIGLATYDGAVQDFGVDEFVALVDRALYRAKQEGRNRLARVQPQRSESAEAES